jgi:condensin complex subunit 2
LFFAFCLLATGDPTAAAVTKQKREKKEAFKVDFYQPLGMSVKEFAKEKFAPPTRGVGINLPGHSLPSSSKPGKKSSRKNKEKEKEKEKREDQVLPDDMHFSSRQLVTLFLKPDFSVCFKLLWSRIFL